MNYVWGMFRKHVLKSSRIGKKYKRGYRDLCYGSCKEWNIKRKSFLLSINLKHFFVKSGTKCGGCNINVEVYEHNTNFIEIQCLNWFYKTTSVLNGSFWPTKPNKSSVMLAETKDRWKLFAKGLLLPYRGTATTLVPDSADVLFVEYFDFETAAL